MPEIHPMDDVMKSLGIERLNWNDLRPDVPLAALLLMAEPLIPAYISLVQLFRRDRLVLVTSEVPIALALGDEELHISHIGTVVPSFTLGLSPCACLPLRSRWMLAGLCLRPGDPAWRNSRRLGSEMNRRVLRGGPDICHGATAHARGLN